MSIINYICQVVTPWRCFRGLGVNERQSLGRKKRREVLCNHGFWPIIFCNDVGHALMHQLCTSIYLCICMDSGRGTFKVVLLYKGEVTMVYYVSCRSRDIRNSVWFSSVLYSFDLENKYDHAKTMSSVNEKLRLYSGNLEVFCIFVEKDKTFVIC